MIKMVSSPEKSLGNIDSSSQEECLQPTVQEIAAYSARLADVADSALESETENTQILAPPNPEPWEQANAVTRLVDLPDGVRLSSGARKWLWSVWKRSSDLTLADIGSESDSVDGAEEPSDRLYILARRLFYRRFQKIVSAAFPGK